MNNASRLSLLLASLALGTLGCEERTAPPPSPSPAAPATPQPRAQTQPQPQSLPTLPQASPSPVSPAAAAAPVTGAAMLSIMGIKLPLPAGFKQVPPANSMRLAEVQVADASGDPSKGCVIAFSTAGGTVESNLSRWSGQVKDASGNPVQGPVVTKEVGGVRASTIELVGTFAGMGDSAPKPNWMLRGTILELPEGLLFVKMTGPAEQMTAAGPAFNSMIDGLTH